MSAVDRLVAKLAVYVPPHMSVTEDGDPYHVKGYYRKGNPAHRVSTVTQNAMLKVPTGTLTPQEASVQTQPKTHNLGDLRARAVELGVPTNDGMSKVDVMDAIRAALGTFDPAMEIDPAKAKDLKAEIDWQNPGHEFDKIKGKYLNADWVLEPKLDGARLRLFLGKTSNTMNTGRRSTVTQKYTERANNFPHLRDAVIPELAGTVLDGELMPAVNTIDLGDGDMTKGSLNTIMAMLNINPQDAVARQQKYGKAVYLVFDVTTVKGEDVTDLTLVQRRAMLEQIMSVLHERAPEIQIVPQFEANEMNIRAALDQGMEGVMLKKKLGVYKPGKRLATWQKIKRISTGDFYVIGYQPGNGSNTGKVGSFKVAYRGPDGEDVYTADVAGITQAERDAATDPETGGLRKSYLGKVLEISGQGRTKNDRIRHPLFVRWRDDKTPEDTDVSQLDLFAKV